jgi:hypothetical protein
MKAQPLVLVLAALNLALLAAFAVSAQGDRAAVVRASAIELVDARGVVRSRLNVEPGGEVVLRLMDPSGAIRVKLGAGDNGSGLMLADETAQPGVHLVARKGATHVTLKAPGGQERVIRPQ